ncbi:MAG TPA: hypothetical protein VGH73_00600, partial [Thermoanaerobaculia bacterium]
RRMSAVLLSAVLLLMLLPRVGAASPKTEVRGAAILEHPCGKVAVKHMGLVHAGKLEEATKLGTQEMQDGWKALPAGDRDTMSGMMQAMSKPEAEFTAEIKAGGLLVVEGKTATLTITQEHKDANGSSSEKWEQRYAIDGGTCRITR